MVDCILMVFENRRAEIRISAMLTSYEMVCATLRRAPSSAYFEFDVHPLPIMVYTLRLDTHKNIKILYRKKMEGEGEGMRIQRIRARNKFNTGVRRNGRVLADRGATEDFDRSFAASAMGCGIPRILTLLGPLRVWE